jgi:hypothetical protein
VERAHDRSSARRPLRNSDDAVTQPFVIFIAPAQYLFGAVDGRAFLVAGDEKADRTDDAFVGESVAGMALRFGIKF